MAIGEVRRINTAYQPQPDAAPTVGVESMAKVIGGAAAVVFSVLALSNVSPHPLTAIAAIAVGAAAFFEGWALASRWTDMPGAASRAGSGSGLTAEALAGAATIVCGVLVLLRPTSLPLILVCSVLLGGALLLGCFSRARLHELAAQHELETGRRAASDTIWAAMGAQILIAGAGIVLGVLGLRGTQEAMLAEIAMLCFGISALLGAAGPTTRIPGMIRY